MRQERDKAKSKHKKEYEGFVASRALERQKGTYAYIRSSVPHYSEDMYTKLDDKDDHDQDLAVFLQHNAAAIRDAKHWPRVSRPVHPASWPLVFASLALSNAISSIAAARGCFSLEIQPRQEVYLV